MKIKKNLVIWKGLFGYWFYYILRYRNLKGFIIIVLVDKIVVRK